MTKIILKSTVLNPRCKYQDLGELLYFMKLLTLVLPMVSADMSLELSVEDWTSLSLS